MKANEAPEKLYLQPRAIEELPYQNIIYTKPLADNSIEYTRTDAFIDKATWYLSYHLDTSKIGVNYKFDFIEEFRNAMKL